MYKKNQYKGVQLQKNDSLTSTGWLVWLLCLAISLSGTLTFLAWAKNGIDWPALNESALSNGKTHNYLPALLV